MLPLKLIFKNRTVQREFSAFDILVCTPGSLSELSFNTGGDLDFTRLKYLVIDEADQMEGEWLKRLESKIPKQCQKLLFSATLASDPQFLAALKVKFKGTIFSLLSFPDIWVKNYGSQGLKNFLVETSNALFDRKSIVDT